MRSYVKELPGPSPCSLLRPLPPRSAIPAVSTSPCPGPSAHSAPPTEADEDGTQTDLVCTAQSAAACPPQPSAGQRCNSAWRVGSCAVCVLGFGGS